eukprot:jgi/Galph1/487/GphlegSOOS_G5173.1
MYLFHSATYPTETTDSVRKRGIVFILRKKGVEGSAKTVDDLQDTEEAKCCGSGVSGDSSSSKRNEKNRQRNLDPLSSYIRSIPSYVSTASYQAVAMVHPFCSRVKNFWKHYLEHCQSLSGTLLRVQYIDSAKSFGEKVSKRMLRQTTEAVENAKNAFTFFVKGDKRNDR